MKFLKPSGQYFIAGDEVVDSKAGKETYGLDRFFSSIQQRVISGLAFFTFSLVEGMLHNELPIRSVKAMFFVFVEGVWVSPTG
ncbi:MAG: transposase [Chloroflexi bacterium]|nr:transposase [Chloroflexota bacterium]